jgi:DNA-damage-inducible protein J
MIHVRIDQDLKSKASETLDAMGLTLSEAVRVFLTRVATDRGISL